MELPNRLAFWGAVGLVLVGVGITHAIEGVLTIWSPGLMAFDLNGFITALAPWAGVALVWMKTNQVERKISANGIKEEELAEMQQIDHHDREQRLARIEALIHEMRKDLE